MQIMTRGKMSTIIGWIESTERLIPLIAKLNSKKLSFRIFLITSCNSIQPTLSLTLLSSMAKIKQPRMVSIIVNKLTRMVKSKQVTSRLIRTGTIRMQLISFTTSAIKTATSFSSKIKVFTQREQKLIRIWFNTIKR